MSKTFTPGSNPGKQGGIFQEAGPRGGLKDNFCTVPDNHTMPPTSAPGHTWKPIHTTPDSKK